MDGAREGLAYIGEEEEREEVDEGVRQPPPLLEGDPDLSHARVRVCFVAR